MHRGGLRGVRGRDGYRHGLGLAGQGADERAADASVAAEVERRAAHQDRRDSITGRDGQRKGHRPGVTVPVTPGRWLPYASVARNVIRVASEPSATIDVSSAVSSSRSPEVSAVIFSTVAGVSPALLVLLR